MDSPGSRITNQTLYQAFAAAEYNVNVDGQWRQIHVGHRHPQLDQALGQADWAIITACNPGGRRHPDAINRQAERDLHQAVTALDWSSFEALNRDPAGDWPDEPALLITAVGQDESCALARRFGQAAIVCARAGEPARLQFLDEPT